MKLVRTLPTSGHMLEAELAHIIKQLIKRRKVIVKVMLGDESNEWHIYNALKAIQVPMPNLPTIHANFSCYEKETYLRDNFRKIAAKSKGICRGRPDIDVPINVSVIRFLDNVTTLTDITGFSQTFPDDVWWSLVIQGLMTIYIMYGFFGVLHRDYNTSNILVQSTDQDFIEYDVPYSFPHGFAHEMDPNCWSKYQERVATHGAKLFIIDFDQAIAYHHAHVGRNTVKRTIIEDVHAFINTLGQFASPSLRTKITEFWKSYYHRSVECCQHRHKVYTESVMESGRIREMMNDTMLNTTTTALRAFINHFLKFTGKSAVFNYFM